MKRLSTRSNPTNLKELDKKIISISTFAEKGLLHFKIDKLELGESSLESDLEIIIIAAAGNTSRRIKIGTISNYSLEDAYDLSELDSSSTLRFRLLIHKANNPKLIAVIEKITPNNDEQSDSILPMKPADLGQRLWKLETAENEGPVLLFNSNVFPSAAGTENFLPFASLVLPDALRQVMLFIANDPDKLEDEDDAWYPWGKWLDESGADRPPADTEDDLEKNRWCEEVVEIFCNLHKFSDNLNAFIKSTAEND
jgi:hypothetical protein